MDYCAHKIILRSHFTRRKSAQQYALASFVFSVLVSTKGKVNKVSTILLWLWVERCFRDSVVAEKIPECLTRHWVVYLDLLFYTLCCTTTKSQLSHWAYWGNEERTADISDSVVLFTLCCFSESNDTGQKETLTNVLNGIKSKILLSSMTVSMSALFFCRAVHILNTRQLLQNSPPGNRHYLTFDIFNFTHIN